MFNASIGVDIGSSSIKAVQVKSGRKTHTITHAGEIELPRGVVYAGEIRDLELVGDALRMLWRDAKFSGRTVTFGVAGLETFVRQVELPWEPNQIFRDALPLRMAAELPVEPSEIVLDYYPLGEVERRTVLQQQALVVGALNAASENAVAAINRARLRAKRADYGPFALIRAATYLNPENTEVPGPPAPGEERPFQVIVDVGAQITNVILHENGRPLFVRTVNAGSDSVTAAIADQIKVSFGAADYLKRALGLGEIIPTALDGDLRGEFSPGDELIAQQVINAMAGSLIQVARESVEYYVTETRTTSPLSQIVLAGGGVLLTGYVDRISAEIGAPAQLLTPISTFGSNSVKTDPHLADSKYSTAFGLAVKVK